MSTGQISGAANIAGPAPRPFADFMRFGPDFPLGNLRNSAATAACACIYICAGTRHAHVWLLWDEIACTNSWQGLVDRLHSIENTPDKLLLEALDFNPRRSKRASFFGWF